MKAVEFRFGLPLLAKDLIEQSALRRTYVLRVVYAAITYGVAFYTYSEIVSQTGSSPLNLLGQGGRLFQALTGIQLFAINLILPALACGTVTTEKERDTLGLLLLTKLSPFTIVLEKLLGRLVSMGTYQLISLPLFALIYGMGGVEASEIVLAIWGLFLWSTVVGAWSVLCSTWHRTTPGAFVSSYAPIPIAFCVASAVWRFNPAPPSFTNNSPNGFWPEALIVASTMTAMAMPVFAAVATMLIAASRLLVKRAFVSPRNYLLELFKTFDRFFEELNQRTTRGVVLARDKDFLPLFHPISWRETRKRSLGTVRYLFRLLVLLETPLVIAISVVINESARTGYGQGPTKFFLSVLWPISVVAVAIHTTSVISSERSRQTLDVLLVAPISNRDLVRQKLAGVSRLIAVLSVPFATLTIFQLVWHLFVTEGLNFYQAQGSNQTQSKLCVNDFISMSLSTLIYLPLLMWITFRIALRVKNPTQCVLAMIGIVAMACVAPMFAAHQLNQWNTGWSEELMWFSPFRVLFHRSFNRTPFSQNDTLFTLSNGSATLSTDQVETGLMLSHFLLAAMLLFVTRRSALNEFSHRVGRAEPNDVRHA